MKILEKDIEAEVLSKTIQSWLVSMIGFLEERVVTLHGCGDFDVEQLTVKFHNQFLGFLNQPIEEVLVQLEPLLNSWFNDPQLYSVFRLHHENCAAFWFVQLYKVGIYTQQDWKDWLSQAWDSEHDRYYILRNELIDEYPELSQLVVDQYLLDYKEAMILE